MAAHLKKRALAEFTRVIQEEKPPEPKRLRLIQKPPPSVPPVQLELHTAANSQEALQSLVAFEQHLPVDLATAENAVRGLLDHFYKEKESFVRVKVLLVLAQVVKTPGFNAAAIVDDLLNAFKREVSHTVSSQIMNTLLVIGKLQPTDRKLHGQLISVANEKLQDTSHLVRCKCLELIGALASCDSTSPAEGESDSLLQVQKMLCSYTQDQDARVRASALRALASLHERGILLDMYVYRQAGGALTDDYESVRLHAVKLLWVMAHLYPESKVTLKKSKEKIRLVDDTFVKICNMMNDLSWKVRAEAAGLLGSLHLVSPRFLEQTLDKKLMSNMRLKMSAHERQKEHFQSGEWASGNKWADDAPRGEVDEDDVSLMSGGACGAFVHGLEDEYLEVRNAAVDSLCELASHKPSFANQSLDYLVDMFNDEIESVRLNAINSLRKMCQHFSLREDQVEIITSGLLKDFNHEIRESVHNMFCCATLATTNGLRDIIFALLDNLKRYPQDRASIWKCMQHLGEHHPALSLPLIPELLSVYVFILVYLSCQVYAAPRRAPPSPLSASNTRTSQCSHVL
ncbi:integrator complex subunit 4-like isoform X1 [Lingula anatina]|uniref:Integrator complex subunit 4-like isoform X1 n=1 Tax=Lingula anatina TaxID=7574 RepID=A0A2R2MPR3_LINAN|nr:integrator complex subunit 4-like isoform X1 [Lingula anatina]|eukprot:XP_023932225.1 integrator complex subunit 4-like isoform X1 [Lingula anatina]